MFRTCHLVYWAVLAMLVSACSSSSGLPATNISQVPPSPEPTAQTFNTWQGSPTPEQLNLLKNLRSQGAAPELSNQVWLNSPPLKLADLRGKVVVVDFWTFDCINCIHVTPALKDWYSKYQDKGLVIIGVHSPEFDYEKDLSNVKDAVARLGVTYPVAIDNDFRTWEAYRNQYWPAMYFVDKAGQLRHVHIGEGDYEYSEQVIRALLAESVS